MPSTVLVITNDHDEHANAVIQELVRRAVPVFRFHPEEFPDPCSISMEIRDGRIVGEIRNGRHRVAFDDICAAWYRRSRSLFAPLPSLNLIKGDLENFIKVQSRVTLTALFDSLQTLWVGQPFKLRRAEVKSQQLAAASKAGLLPFTTTLPRGHALDSVALAPTIFQPYIEKAYELRCVVMGDKIFAAKLNSQEQESTRTDWRAGKPDGGDVGHEVFDLPEPVQAALHRIIRGFEINFASIDLIVTPEGEFVFLDLNPNGQWLWLEDKLGLPLVASMADLLTTEYSPAA